MPEIEHEIKINETPQKVFAALTTADGLKSWYSAHVEGDGTPGHEWRFQFTERPTFRWEVTESTAPTRVAWRCTEGPGDSVGTEVAVQLSPADPGRTLVELAHSGWPGTDGNYRKCNTYWGVLLYHLKQYAETGVARPAFE
jgi:uncharacterized protein YndB with AHSA1/START domain